MSDERPRCAALVTRVYDYGREPVTEPCRRLAKPPDAMPGIPACNVHRRGLSEGRFR